MGKAPQEEKKDFSPAARKKIISVFVMLLGILAFFIGFYLVGPIVNYKGYVVIGGLIATVYGFINILT